MFQQVESLLKFRNIQNPLPSCWLASIHLTITSRVLACCFADPFSASKYRENNCKDAESAKFVILSHQNPRLFTTKETTIIGFLKLKFRMYF